MVLVSARAVLVVVLRLVVVPRLVTVAVLGGVMVRHGQSSVFVGR
jgi:hypothetical protein